MTHVSGGQGGVTADVDVQVHQGAGAGGGASVGRGRSRSRAGSVSFPGHGMSPSVEKGYNLGLPGHSRQVRARYDVDTACVVACFVSHLTFPVKHFKSGQDIRC